MGKLFSFDSPVSKLLSRIADLFLINLLWTLCSVPVITIGASTTAMYSCLKRLHSQTGHIPSNFLRAFRESFSRATLVWLGALLVGAALALSMLLLSFLDFSFRIPMLFFCSVVAVLLLVLLAWFFPMLASYGDDLKTTFLKSVVMGFGNPLSSLELLLLSSVPAGLLIFKPAWFYWSLIFWALLGAAVIAQLCFLVFQGVCRKYTQPSE